MPKLLTHKILTKLFVIPFYKENAGFFLFLFTSIFSSFFYINILDAIPLNLRFFWNMILTFIFVSNYYMLFLFLAFSVYYSSRYYSYYIKKCKEISFSFLQYSINAASTKLLFLYGLRMSILFQMPFIVYSIFAFAFGIYFGKIAIPIIGICFQIITVFLFALGFIRNTNQLQKSTSSKTSQFFKKIFRIRLSRLFLYQILHHHKISYLLAKCLSFALISVVFYRIADGEIGTKELYLFLFTIVLSHSILIYQHQKFHAKYLSFERNFSVSKWYILSPLITYSILLVPEFVWFVLHFKWVDLIPAMIWSVGFILFLFYILIPLNGKLNSYLKTLLVLAFLIHLIILYKVQWILFPMYIITAGYVYTRRRKCIV